MLRALEAMSSQPSGPGSSGGSSGPAVPSRREPFGREQRGFRPAQGPQAAPQHGGGRIDHAKPRHRFVRDGEVPVIHVAAPRGWEQPVPAPTRTDAEFVRLTQALEDHRERLVAAERARAEALLQVRTLQTKAAHTEMALSDAVALAQSRLREIAALQETLRSRPEPRREERLAAGEPAASRPPQWGLEPRQHAARAVESGPVERGPVEPRQVEVRQVEVRKPEVRPSVPVEPVGKQPAVRPGAGAAVQAPVEVKRKRGRPPKVRLLPAVPEPEPQPVEWWLAPLKSKVRRRI